MEQDLQEITAHAKSIKEFLAKYRFNVNNEKQLQGQIWTLLSVNRTAYKEFRLDEKNIVDFIWDGVAIEVKIQTSSRMEIYRQCERYCSFDKVKALILVTNRSMGFPESINGKPCFLLNLGKAWL